MFRNIFQIFYDCILVLIVERICNIINDEYRTLVTLPALHFKYDIKQILRALLTLA